MTTNAYTKDGNIITISYKIRFIDSTIFIWSLLSSLNDDLVKEFQGKYKQCPSYLEYFNAENDSLKLKSSNCCKKYEKEFAKEWTKRFPNAYIFFQDNIKNKVRWYWEKVFIHMNAWVVGKHLMKYHYFYSN